MSRQEAAGKFLGVVNSTKSEYTQMSALSFLRGEFPTVFDQTKVISWVCGLIQASRNMSMC